MLLHGDNSVDSLKKLAYYKRVHNDIMQTESITSRQKERLIKVLSYGLIHNEIEQHKKQQEELENIQRIQAERENLIYRQFLASRGKSSSVLRDFITMRY